jgi:hypothetical protein
MYDAKTKLEFGSISKDTALFYRALGAFNTNMVATIVKDPNALKEVIDYIKDHCTIHAAECGMGHSWDELHHSCVRLPEGGPDPETGPTG